MSLKRILVLLSATETSPAGLELAALVANRFEGHIDALYAEPNVSDRLSQVVHGEGAAISGTGLQDLVAHLQRAADDAYNLFERTMQRYGIAAGERAGSIGVPSCSWQAVHNFGTTNLLRHALFADLVVVARPSPHEEPLADAINAALFTVGHPVMIAPTVVPGEVGSRVLIGWNPTLQAARAVARSLPFLKRAQEVTLVSVTSGTSEAAGVSEAGRYLFLHGIASTVRDIPADQRSVGEILLGTASQLRADLLVIGGYSHSRLRELILGGVTLHVLRHAELPVLMVH